MGVIKAIGSAGTEIGKTQFVHYDVFGPVDTFEEYFAFS